MNPLVSIVILNWNGRKYLEKFLPSVLSSTYTNYHVVVVDNASSDDSVSFLRNNHPGVSIIKLPDNFGYARGYNEALRQVTSDYYILLNSDVEVEKTWIEPMVALMESDTNIAACQPKLLQYNDKQMFEYAGAAGGWLDYLGYPFAKGRIFDVCENDIGQYDRPEPIFWASGAAMFVRGSIFHKLRGLDEYFFAHQEEIDICWRMQLAGYTVYSCPQSVVYHVGGGTLPKGNSQKVFLNFRNNLIMMAKNLPRREATWKILYRFFLDAISAVKSLFAGQGTYFIAVVKAHFGFLYWLFFFKKRKNRRIRNRNYDGYLKKSVVWNHFVLRKKRFIEIVPKEK